MPSSRKSLRRFHREYNQGIYGNKCFHCQKLAGHDYTREHVIPRSVLNTKIAISISHHQCNQDYGFLCDVDLNVNYVNKRMNIKSKTLDKLYIILKEYNNLSTQEYFKELLFVRSNRNFIQDFIHAKSM